MEVKVTLSGDDDVIQRTMKGFQTEGFQIEITAELQQEARVRGLTEKELFALAIQRQVPGAIDIEVDGTPPPPPSKGTH
jgi:hypothetical protein